MPDRKLHETDRDLLLPLRECSSGEDDCGAEIEADREAWAKLHDPGQRRRWQNKYAQRRYRKRKRAAKLAAAASRDAPISSSGNSSSSNMAGLEGYRSHGDSHGGSCGGSYGGSYGGSMVSLGSTIDTADLVACCSSPPSKPDTTMERDWLDHLVNLPQPPTLASPPAEPCYQNVHPSLTPGATTIPYCPTGHAQPATGIVFPLEDQYCYCSNTLSPNFGQLGAPLTTTVSADESEVDLSVSNFNRYFPVHFDLTQPTAYSPFSGV